MERKQAVEILENYMRTQESWEDQEILDAFGEAVSALAALDQYESTLKNTFGECEDLLPTLVESVCRHADDELETTPIKARLLTDEEADLWLEYKQSPAYREARKAHGLC